MQASPLKVCVTGAAGQIAYSLLYQIGHGDVFGKDQVSSPIIFTPNYHLCSLLLATVSICILVCFHPIAASDIDSIGHSSHDQCTERSGNGTAGLRHDPGQRLDYVHCTSVLHIPGTNTHKMCHVFLYVSYALSSIVLSYTV